jgi:nitrogen fixation/metabolism regulation signal transduction histidine kinase
MLSPSELIPDTVTALCPGTFRRLIAAADRIAGGDLSTRGLRTAHARSAALTRSFNVMAQSLAQHHAARPLRATRTW